MATLETERWKQDS